MTTTASSPTYQQALRAIGRYFDQQGYRHVLVSEVDDGYVARGFHARRGTLGADGIALPMADVLALINRREWGFGAPGGDGGMPPLCPTGYEDCFRLLGHDLDAAGASAVSLVELGSGILLSYTAGGRRHPERVQTFYDPPRIEGLLTEGYQRRSGSARTA